MRSPQKVCRRLTGLRATRRASRILRPTSLPAVGGRRARPSANFPLGGRRSKDDFWHAPSYPSQPSCPPHLARYGRTSGCDHGHAHGAPYSPVPVLGTSRYVPPRQVRRVRRVRRVWRVRRISPKSLTRPSQNAVVPVAPPSRLPVAPPGTAVPGNPPRVGHPAHDP